MKWAYDSVWGDWCMVGPCRCTVDFVDRSGSDEDMRGDYLKPQHRWDVAIVQTDEYDMITEANLAGGWARTAEEGKQAALAFLRTLAVDVTTALAKDAQC